MKARPKQTNQLNMKIQLLHYMAAHTAKDFNFKRMDKISMSRIPLFFNTILNK